MFSLPAQLEAGSDAQPARVRLGKPTKPMRDEAVDAGGYESKLWHDKDYPKVQIQQNTDLATTTWEALINPPVVVNGERQVTVSPPVGNRYHRLKYRP
jgi:hypothetical protein